MTVPELVSTDMRKLLVARQRRRVRFPIDWSYTLKLIGLYAACRGAILGATVLYPAPTSVAQRIETYDGAYYAHITQIGYPTSIGSAGGSPIAFFPGYPLVVRGFDLVTRMPTWAGLLAISLAAGAVATILV
ncbi:MAG: hypothetical protein M0007_01215, partial [Actinomycetota bacterium]|nr:hypothetical protein [Actinomycetota bacterium]